MGNVNMNIFARYFFLIGMVFSVSLPAYAVDYIELKGLFGKKAALVDVDGKEITLKLGVPKAGVTLLEVKGKGVILDVQGQRRQFSLSKQTTGSYKKPATKIVRIASGKGGHYWVTGKVNIHSVDFVVDTGATTISMNASTAKRLGLDYSSGEPIRLSTANGLKDARLVKLNKVTIGQITQYNVKATIAYDDALPFVLLGNSFLQGVNWRKENGVLILESKI
jgi:aspartyl protease family protein